MFAQQSVRENKRTRRTPRDVIDGAMWGVFEAGWQASWGADADHLKQLSDPDAFIDSGYTFYTIDPSDYVDDQTQTASPVELMAKVEALPWSILETNLEEMRQRYLNKTIDLGTLGLTFEPGITLAGGCKVRTCNCPYPDDVPAHRWRNERSVN